MHIEIKNGVMEIPDNLSIGYIDGDGIGPEITEAMIKVINSSLELAYSGAKSIEWIKIPAGKESFLKSGKYLPEESLESIRKLVITMKSTLNILPDKRDINMLLRKRLGLYSNVRVIKYLPGIEISVNSFKKLNITVFRDSINTSHIFYHSSESTDDLLGFLSENYDMKITPDSSIFMVSQSRYRTEKVVRLAAEYYKRNGSKKITVLDNPSNPEFVEWCLGELQKHDNVNFEAIGINRFMKKLLTEPESFDIIILDNIVNKIIVDYIAYAINIEYGASIGDDCALFEAVQNSMPSAGGYDVADPLSFILSGSMMLKYIGWKDAGEIIENAVVSSFLDNKIPGDLTFREDINPVKCSEFSDELIKRMKPL